MHNIFKLKQKYPSLPKDWEVGMEVGLGDRNYGYSPCHGKYSDHRKLDNSEVEKSEEFWEEIIPKEWEILSFVNDINEYFTKGVDGIFVGSHDIGRDYSWRTDEHMLKVATKCKINSVKRLSDGVVFTLGDVAQTTGKYPHKITSIEVHQKSLNREEKDGIDRIWLNWEKDAGGNWLESTEKVEELHTSKDGYKINTGDKYFIVDNFRIREVVGGTFLKSRWDGFRFKDRENAEDWIIGNKPCLTLNDVMQRFTVRNINCDELKELIKTRL